YPFCHSHRGPQRRKNGSWLAYDGIKSGHFYAAKSGHYHLAATITNVDKLCYVKLRNPNQSSGVSSLPMTTLEPRT
ncbi:hypothetical protein, partial [Paraburkholderia sp. 31.1]|uniref:hypothetical protein n=1 Tax=Paraburkholderia sp. 31.1 TaxID=2615205 RepID=UPI001CA3FADF